MAKAAGRGFTPIRHTFVQLREPGADGKRGSTLGKMVAGREGRALNAYLLLLLNDARLEKREENDEPPLAASVWARALSPQGGPLWPPSAMSRVWNDLEERGLIARVRRWKRADVRARSEDGKRLYKRPRPDELAEAEDRQSESYFTLPDAYWLEEWHSELSLPGRALLLVMLSATSQKSEMYMRHEDGPAWYGVSRDSVRSGITELIEKGLLTYRTEKIADSWSGSGLGERYFYSLTGSFSTAARAELSQTAATAARSRAGRRAAAEQPEEEPAR